MSFKEEFLSELARKNTTVPQVIAGVVFLAMWTYGISLLAGVWLYHWKISLIEMIILLSDVVLAILWAIGTDAKRRGV